MRMDVYRTQMIPVLIPSAHTLQAGIMAWVLLLTYYLICAMRNLQQRPYTAFRYAKDAQPITHVCKIF